jgi:hypothetical protein
MIPVAIIRKKLTVFVGRGSKACVRTIVPRQGEVSRFTEKRITCHPERSPALFLSRRGLAGAGRREGSAFRANVKGKADPSGKRRLRDDDLSILSLAFQPLKYRFRSCRSDAMRPNHANY